MRYVYCEEDYRQELEAKTLEDAIKESIDMIELDDSFDNSDRALFVNYSIRTMEEDSDDEIDEYPQTYVLDQQEPKCNCSDGHIWVKPLEVVGGIDSNPGVRGHGGGVIETELCLNCGKYRITDTFAYNPLNGEQGFTTIEYSDADRNSIAYLIVRDLDDVHSTRETGMIIIDEDVTEELTDRIDYVCYNSNLPIDWGVDSDLNKIVIYFD